MIAYISGALVSAGENYIVIDNHGMGYRIFVSGKFLEHIPAYGTQIKIYTHMYIREDELTLYGFHSEEELSVFRILIGISGVGPKVAMAILTALTIQELQLAVISEDVKTISTGSDRDAVAHGWSHGHFNPRSLHGERPERTGK